MVLAGGAGLLAGGGGAAAAGEPAEERWHIILAIDRHGSCENVVAGVVSWRIGGRR